MTNIGSQNLIHVLVLNKVENNILCLMKMKESPPKGWKTLLEKEKLLFTSNVCFLHSVFFKRLVLQTRKNKGLFGKGLILNHIILTFNDLK